MKAGHFDNLPPLSKNDALRILKTPINKLALSSDYYKAVFHLAKFHCSDSERALLELVQSDSKEPSILIAKRKAIEVLGRMKCKKAILHIGKNLKSFDPYIVENSAWALQEIGCTNIELHNTIGVLLDNPKNNQRVLIQSLAKMNAITELSRIQKVNSKENIAPPIKGACIAAIKILTGKLNDPNLLREFLDLDNQNDRQSAVQDIIDSKACHFLVDVIHTPIAPFFRLRALDFLWPTIQNEGLEFNILEAIDFVILDDPRKIRLVKNEQQFFDTDTLLNDLFNTDFKECYSSLNRLINIPPNNILTSLKYNLNKFKKDYGAIYFLIVLFRYLGVYSENFKKLGMELVSHCLDKSWSPFMKFKPQAILLSFELDIDFFKMNISNWLDERLTPSWICRYSVLICLEKLIQDKSLDLNIEEMLKNNFDSNEFIRLKSKKILSQSSFK